MSVCSISKFLCVAIVCLFLLLCSIALCEHNTNDVSIPLLMTILVVSTRHRYDIDIMLDLEIYFEVKYLGQSPAI